MLVKEYDILNLHVQQILTGFILRLSMHSGMSYVCTLLNFLEHMLHLYRSCAALACIFISSKRGTCINAHELNVVCSH